MRAFLSVFTLVFSMTTVVAMVCPSAAQADQGPILAVFDMEDRGSGLDPKVLINLTDYLAVLMAEGGYQVVPRSQVRERIKKQQLESKKECYEQSCQVELGRELAAQKSLATQIFKIGGVCKVTATLFDLRRATTEKAASAGGSCEEKELLAAVEQIAKKMAIPAKSTTEVVSKKDEQARKAKAERDRQVMARLARERERAQKEMQARHAAEKAREAEQARQAAERARKAQRAKMAEQAGKDQPEPELNKAFDVDDLWWNFSMKLGGLMPSFSADQTIWIERDDGNPVDHVDEEGIRNVFGVLVDVGADFKLGGYFSVGPYFSFIVSEGQDEESNGGIWSYLSLGARLKGRFAVGRRLEIRPALSFGFGYFPFTDEFNVREKRDAMMDLSDVTGLCLEFSVEFAYYAWDSMAFLVDIGIVGQPVGGGLMDWPIDQFEFDLAVPTSVTMNPFLYIGLGLEFGG